MIILGKKVDRKAKNTRNKYISIQRFLFKSRNFRSNERIKERNRMERSKNKVIWKRVFITKVKCLVWRKII